MITRSSKTRALQEITNVENEPEKPTNKRTRANEVVVEEAIKVPRNIRRKSTSLSDSSDSTQTTTASISSSFSSSFSSTVIAATVPGLPSPKPQQTKSPFRQRQPQQTNISKEIKDELFQEHSNTIQPVELSNELNLSVESFSSHPTSTPSSSTKKIQRKKLKRSDPGQCLEIISQMYERYYLQEDEFRVGPYIQHHVDINQKMRSILIDWLIEVHFKFRLQSPTLWLCVNILDRFLNAKLIARNRLQLLGVAALLIACKFEEIFPPEIQDCVYITDRAYSKEEILAMEQVILQTLDYQLCIPTGFHFITRYLNLINASEILRHVTFYYAERNLQENSALVFKPSLFAAGAVYAALCQQTESLAALHPMTPLSNETPPEEHEMISIWPDILIEECGYDEKDVLYVAKGLMFHVTEEPVTTSMRRLISVKRKYLNDKFHRIAELELPKFTHCKGE